MTQSGHECLTVGVALCATAPVPSVVAVAGFKELHAFDAIANALGYKKDTSGLDPEKCPKHVGATGASQFCNNRALNSASENALGGCTAILGKYVVGAG